MVSYHSRIGSKTRCGSDQRPFASPSPKHLAGTDEMKPGYIAYTRNTHVIPKKPRTKPVCGRGIGNSGHFHIGRLQYRHRDNKHCGSYLTPVAAKKLTHSASEFHRPNLALNFKLNYPYSQKRIHCSTLSDILDPDHNVQQ